MAIEIERKVSFIDVPSELTDRRKAILQSIARSSMTFKEIQQHLHLDKSTLSRALKYLEDEEFIIVRPVRLNKKTITHYFISKKGEEVMINLMYSILHSMDQRGARIQALADEIKNLVSKNQ